MADEEDPERRLLPLEERLPVAHASTREFPPWSTVHHYFRLWRLDGTWEKINAVLRERIRFFAEVAIPNRALAS